MKMIRLDYHDQGIEHAGAQLMHVDGERIAANSGRTISIRDPSTGLEIGTAPAGDRPDVDRAVAVARRTFRRGDWRKLGNAARQKILWRASDLLEHDGESMARVEALNSGMLMPLARRMVSAGAEALRYYAGYATKVYGLTTDISSPQRGEFHTYTLREPVGVVGVIIPWNVPLVLTLAKVGAALTAGCSVVVKPSEETPFSALRVVEILEQAGVPKGVVNVITGYGHEAGAALAEHPDVDKVAFTGSTEIGKAIVRAAAGNLKKVTLELGGKSPVILFDDANLDRAIPAIAGGIFMHAGQLCIAGSRLYVQRRRFGETVERLAAAARSLRIGHAFDPDAQLGPLISDKQLRHVLGLIESGSAQGAELVTGGGRVGDRGYFVQPTILANPEPDARVVKEEIFGPVLTVAAFDEFDEVMTTANDTHYGLAAAVWTENTAKAHLAARELQAGLVWINCAFVTDATIPGGGYKQSGWGREFGVEGLEAYFQTKSVVTSLAC